MLIFIKILWGFESALENIGNSCDLSDNGDLNFESNAIKSKKDINVELIDQALNTNNELFKFKTFFRFFFCRIGKKRYRFREWFDELPIRNNILYINEMRYSCLLDPIIFENLEKLFREDSICVALRIIRFSSMRKYAIDSYGEAKYCFNTYKLYIKNFYEKFLHKATESLRKYKEEQKSNQKKSVIKEINAIYAKFKKLGKNVLERIWSFYVEVDIFIYDLEQLRIEWSSYSLSFKKILIYGFETKKPTIENLSYKKEMIDKKILEIQHLKESILKSFMKNFNEKKSSNKGFDINEKFNLFYDYELLFVKINLMQEILNKIGTKNVSEQNNLERLMSISNVQLRKYQFELDCISDEVKGNLELKFAVKEIWHYTHFLIFSKNIRLIDITKEKRESIKLIHQESDEKISIFLSENYQVDKTEALKIIKDTYNVKFHKNIFEEEDLALLFEYAYFLCSDFYSEYLVMLSIQVNFIKFMELSDRRHRYFDLDDFRLASGFQEGIHLLLSSKISYNFLKKKYDIERNNYELWALKK